MRAKKLTSGVGAVLVIGALAVVAIRPRSDPHATNDDIGMGRTLEPLETFPSTASAAGPVPGDRIRVTLVAMRADTLDDGGATGETDEPYVEVFRGLGSLDQRYYQRIQLPEISTGETNILNKVVYDGPRVLLTIPYVALDFYEGDDIWTDDHLGGPVWFRYEHDQIAFAPAPEVTETSGPFSGSRPYLICDKDARYVVWIRAELH